MSRLDDILVNKRIPNNYYRSVISSIQYPQNNSYLNYKEKVFFPKVMFNENDFILAVRKRNLGQIFSSPISTNLFTKSNFTNAFAPQNVYIDFNEGSVYYDAPLTNKTQNLYVSKKYDTCSFFETPFVAENGVYRLAVDEENIMLFVNDEPTIIIQKNDPKIYDLYQNFVIYLYILYISEDAVGISEEKQFYLKTEEQLAVEGLK